VSEASALWHSARALFLLWHATISTLPYAQHISWRINEAFKKMRLGFGLLLHQQAVVQHTQSMMLKNVLHWMWVLACPAERLLEMLQYY